MHHSGLFVNLGRTCYIGGEVSHIDFCNSDELSMLELQSMTNELGLKGVKHFHYSKDGINDCSSLGLMQNDNDALNLVNFIDVYRMVGVFVEHENNNTNVNSSESESVGQPNDDFPNIDEPLNFVGDNEDSIELNDNHMDISIHPVSEEHCDPVNKGHCDPVSEGHCDIMDYNESNDSEDEQSIGSDSELSNFVDSECDVSDDDILFDANIDDEVEWGGLHMSNRQALSSNVQLGNELGQNSQEGQNQHNGHPIFNSRIDMLDPKFELGMCFVDTATFRKAVRQHSITKGREVIFTINDKYKVQAKCKHETCPWLIYASKVQNEDTMQVKKYNAKHKCPRLQRVTHANSKWLADMYKDEIWTNPKWPVDSMITIMQKKVKLVFNKSQMYRAKRKVFKMGSGCDSEQYALLWSYAEEIKKSNPETTVKIKCKQVEGKAVFKRFCICWGSLKRGFLEGCRPVICLDGCHLKSSSGGILLSAVGIDANNCMYPFAYAVVEKEKKNHGCGL